MSIAGTQRLEDSGIHMVGFIAALSLPVSGLPSFAEQKHSRTTLVSTVTATFVREPALTGGSPPRGISISGFMVRCRTGHVSHRSLPPGIATDMCTAGPEIIQISVLKSLYTQYHRPARRPALSRTLGILETTSQ